MSAINRREFAKMAAAIGASAAFGELRGAPSRTAWRERRDLFPEGVASGDPDSASVLLWTRSPRTGGPPSLRVEVAEDEGFGRVVASAVATVSADSDWTCRVLAGGLKPARVYWYRFTDREGNGSRVGAPSRRPSRTIHGRCHSPSSVARTPTRARRMPTAR